jgi:SagB-type dehydrogenase family enzyme
MQSFGRFVAIAAVSGVLVLVVSTSILAGGGVSPGDVSPLPKPKVDGNVSLEEAIAGRRSVREFLEEPLTVADISQLCWAGQGITHRQHEFRASPSAGALYPIELYLVRPEGVDRYVPRGHALTRHAEGDLRARLQAAALDQSPVGQAPCCVVIAAVPARTARKYGPRAERYCLLEAGHVAQNILLQATALRLGGVPIGAFEDKRVSKLLKLSDDYRVLYLVPIGFPAD